MQHSHECDLKVHSRNKFKIPLIFLRLK